MDKCAETTRRIEMSFDFQYARLTKNLANVLFVVITALAFFSTEVNAFPVFCSDIASVPNHVLTGCQIDDDQVPMTDEPLVETPPSFSYPYDLAFMLSTQPKNGQLFHVGRNALNRDANAKKKGKSSKGDVDRQSAADNASKNENEVSTSKLLSQEETWYTMPLDKDGTYLFFGDFNEKDEKMTFKEEDELLPEGIGIGKKWQF